MYKNMASHIHAVILFNLDNSEHFPGYSEAESINTLGTRGFVQLQLHCGWQFYAEQIPGCQSIYAISLRAAWEMFTFHINGTVGQGLMMDENG